MQSDISGPPAQRGLPNRQAGRGHEQHGLGPRHGRGPARGAAAAAAFSRRSESVLHMGVSGAGWCRLAARLWRAAFVRQSTNVTAPFCLIREFLPELKARRGFPHSPIAATEDAPRNPLGTPVWGVAGVECGTLWWLSGAAKRASGPAGGARLDRERLVDPREPHQARLRCLRHQQGRALRCALPYRPNFIPSPPSLPHSREMVMIDWFCCLS